MKLDPALQKRYEKTLANSNLFLSDPKNSQSLLAKGAGVSSSVISPFLKGTYKGSPENVIKKLEDFFSLSEKRVNLVIEPGYVKTAQSNRIWYMAQRAHVLHKISVIISASGIGKTKTFKEYTKKNTGVYYIECDPHMTGKMNFTKAVCSALGVPSDKGNRDQFLKARTIAAERGALLIFDHIEFISSDTRGSDSVYALIRSLNDHEIGCVLGGNYRIREKVLTTSLEDFNQQFASRSEIRVIPDDFSQTDVRSVIRAVTQCRLADEIENYLFRIANHYIGGLRIMVAALNSAILQANSVGEYLNISFLQEALSAITSEVKPQYKKKKGNHIGIAKQKIKDQDSKQIDPQKEQAHHVA